MATLYITEYKHLAPDLNGRAVLAGLEPAAATQTVSIGGASVQSAPFAADTKFVRVEADAVCSVLFAVNPTATASSPRLAANAAEYFGVAPGLRLAVITNT